MVAGLCMGGRMLVRRVIAAADLAALEADAQVQPLVAGGEAVLTTEHRLGQLGDLDVVQVRAGGDLLSIRWDQPAFAR